LLPVVSEQPQPKTYADQTHTRLQAIWATIKENEERQSRQVQFRENQKRRSPGRIQPGDEVLYRRFQLVGPEGKRKQELLYEGPFKVVRMVKDSVAELAGLPMGAPTLLNVQFLRKYHRDEETELLRAREAPAKAVEGTDGADEWEVEEIRDARNSRERKEYLLKWKGYDRPTWVASKDLTHCKELLTEFRERQRRFNPRMRRQP